MQKIMFNDKYGLTQAVLEGRKTMTRRIIDAPSNAIYMEPVLDLCGNIIKVYAIDPDLRRIGVFSPKYRVGEVVAVAQSYKDAGYPNTTIQTGKCVRKGHDDNFIEDLCLGQEGDWFIDMLAGWENKMFVHAEMMPHQIRITNVRVERLQDISDEDCLREGIRKVSPLQSLICLNASTYQIDGPGCENTHYTSPRGAFAALIDKVSGRGTWGSNPWVFVYEFELVK